MQEQKHAHSLLNSRIVIWVSQILAIIATVALLVMMGISVADVAGRYFFLKPIRGAFEMVGMPLVIAAAMGMGYCELRRGHIRISLFTDRFPEKVRSAASILAYVICIGTTGLMSWQGFLRTSDYLGKQLGRTTEAVGMPIWPFILAFSIGFGWICIVFILELIETIRSGFKK